MIDEILREKIAVEIQRRRILGLKLMGDTFPYRQKIREAGGLWDAVGRCWLLPDLEAIKQLPVKYDAKHKAYRITEKAQP